MAVRGLNLGEGDLLKPLAMDAVSPFYLGAGIRVGLFNLQVGTAPALAEISRGINLIRGWVDESELAL